MADLFDVTRIYDTDPAWQAAEITNPLRGDPKDGGPVPRQPVQGEQDDVVNKAAIEAELTNAVAKANRLFHRVKEVDIARLRAPTDDEAETVRPLLARLRNGGRRDYEDIGIAARRAARCRIWLASEARREAEAEAARQAKRRDSLKNAVTIDEDEIRSLVETIRKAKPAEERLVALALDCAAHRTAEAARRRLRKITETASAAADDFAREGHGLLEVPEIDIPEAAEGLPAFVKRLSAPFTGRLRGW